MADNLIQFHSNSSTPTMHAIWPTGQSWVLSPSLATIQSFHTTLYQQAFGAPQASPLAIVWIQSPSPNAAPIGDEQLAESALQSYQDLGDRLAQIARLDEPPVEAGAIVSADRVLTSLAHHRIPPPEITWHGGDAIAMLWRLGSTSYAITVTEGEFGYVVRSGRKTLRRQHSIPLDQVARLVAE